MSIATERRPKGGHGEGSFYETAGGPRAAITVRMADGSSKRVCLRGRTKHELQQKAEEARRRIERGPRPNDRGA